jgi:hypothetical protein
MKTSYHDRLLYGYSLIVGQGMLTLSSFFWNEGGNYSVNGSTILILAMVFWAIGFIGIFGSFKSRFPLYSRVGLIYAFYGCVGGIAFGYEGFYSTILGVTEKIGLEAYARFPVQANLVLYWAGPAFPLTLIILGVLIVWKKIYPRFVGAIIFVGAVGFPVSRILRIMWVAHVVDFILLAGVVLIALELISNEEKEKQLSL